MKLYEINQNYKNLLDLIENDEVDADVLQNALDSVKADITSKCENIGALIKNTIADIEALKAEEERLAMRRKGLENKVKALKDYTLNCLNISKVKKIQGKLFTFAVRESKAVNVTNIEKLDNKYIVTKTVESVDKKTLLADLKDGAEVAGAEIQVNKNLTIK